MYCCVSIFQLISSLPTYPPTTVNLTYTYPYLFHSRCCYVFELFFWVRRMPLDTSANFYCVLLCKYISTYFFLTHIPTHNCKLNLYTLTYSIRHGACASVEVDTVFSCVSIFQLISSLPTYPPTTVNLTYTYPYLFHSRCCSLGTWPSSISVPP